MSGGHFNYEQYRLENIAAAIDEIIELNGKTMINDLGYEEGYDYPPDIIAKFREASKNSQARSGNGTAS